MRLAIIADTHMPKGARRLPEACLRELERAELILHLGDFKAALVLAELEAVGPPVVAVHGNVDDAELCRQLPPERELELDGVRLGLVHDAGPATGRLTRMRRRFPGANAVLFGHSHLPLHEHDPQSGFQIFNPGSPTERRRSPTHTMGTGEVADGGLSLRHLQLS